jgi:hypothetical protein
MPSGKLPTRRLGARGHPWLVPSTAFLCVAAMTLLVIGPGRAAAASTFGAVADAHAHSEHPATNFGSDIEIRVDGSPVVRGYLRFSVQGLTGSVTRAVLRLYVSSANSTGYSVAAVADTAWSEGAITWNNAPPISSTITGSSGGVAAASWSEVDVTPLVRGNGLVSFGLTTKSDSSVRPASRESGANGPQLVVTTGSGSDTTAPTRPTGLAATVSGSSQIDLTWSASTDAVGVAGYTVYRDGTAAGTVGAASGTRFSDTGLAASSTYSYAVDAFDAAGNRSSKSSSVTATTASGSTSSAPVIAAAGDIACDPASSNFNGGAGSGSSCHQKAVSDLLVGTDLKAVLPLGDNQYYCGGLQAFQASYHPSWGRVKSITRPAVGNHEYLTSGGTGCSSSNAGARGYFSYFGAAAGDPSKGYYSFDVGSWHLIALNSQCSQAGGCSASSPQGKWLAGDLAAHRNACTLAYWHIPLFSSGGRANSNTRSFWDQLYAAGAEVVLSGHDHTYERFAPQTPSGSADPARGIRQWVVGTGGANHTHFATTFANSQVRNDTTFGVLRLTLRPDGYDWRFVPEKGGGFTDSGSGTCH